MPSNAETEGWMVAYGLLRDSARYKHLHVYCPQSSGISADQNAMSGKRFGKLGIEIDRIVGLTVTVSPTASIRAYIVSSPWMVWSSTTSRSEVSMFLLPAGPDDLYAGLAFRESETKHSAMRQSGRFRLNLIIERKQSNSPRLFRRLVIPGTISFFRLVFRAGECMQIPDCRHHQEVPQIAVPADTDICVNITFRWSHAHNYSRDRCRLRQSCWDRPAPYRKEQSPRGTLFPSPATCTRQFRIRRSSYKRG